MKPVYQTDFSAGKGNALQACVATLFSLPLEDVPNFVEAADYRMALQEWLQTRNLSFLKVNLEAGKLAFPAPDSLCILAGNSPRGNHRHAVVARSLVSREFELVFDPHPDNTGIIGVPLWVGFFVALRVLAE
ncbi:MAG: hypothetical protein AAF518_00065 [Spirochaetota bacterium]